MFIVIDGIDGCGKTTQVKLLEERIKKLGKKVATSKWKDSAYVDRLFIGDLLKRFQDGTVRIPPEARTFLLAADISNRLESSIKPALTNGMVVIGDRYIYKVIAQGIARGLSKKWLDNLFSFAIEPDMKIFLDIDPEEAAKRITAYREISFYEAGMDVLDGDDRVCNFINFQRQVRENLLLLANQCNGIIIDASRAPQEQHQQISTIVEKKMGLESNI
ncbi:MAG: dTMP kinase [bacterium]